MEKTLHHIRFPTLLPNSSNDILEFFSQWSGDQRNIGLFQEPPGQTLWQETPQECPS